MRPASWPIAVRIAVAGVAGTFAAVAAFVTRASDFLTCHTMSIGCRRWADAPSQSIVVSVLESLLLTLFALVLTAPLIAIAVAAGLAFRRSITRRLLPWSLASPIAVWLFVCVVEALKPQNASLAARGFPERLRIHIVSAENLLDLCGAAVAGLAFYAMSTIGRGSPAPEAGDAPPRV